MKSQRGFTLIELLVAAAIAGLIMPVVVSMLFQLTTGTSRVTADLIVQQDINTLSGFISRDIAQAQTIDLIDLLVDPGAPPVDYMRAEWIDETGWSAPGEEAHFVEYTLSPPRVLRTLDGVTLVAGKYVDDIQFSRTGKFISVVLTSSLGGRAETLTYYVTPRPDVLQ